MGCRIKGQPVEGLLFHPESFLTHPSKQIFENFLASQIRDEPRIGSHVD